MVELEELGVLGPVVSDADASVISKPLSLTSS